MLRTPLRKCVKCRHRCVSLCHMCGDSRCFFHSSLEANGKRICPECKAKYYLIWLQEKDFDLTTEESYLDWLQNASNMDRLRESVE